MNVRVLYFALLLISFNSLVFAQERLEKKADEAYDAYAFMNARDYYLKVANRQEQPSQELLEKLGDSYYYNGDYANASVWYKQLYESDVKISSEYLYRYALTLKSNGDYKTSDRVMEEFYKSAGNDYRGRLFNKKRDYLKEIDLQSGNFEVTIAGFNSSLSDIGPAFYEEGVLFSSNRDRHGMSKNIDTWTGESFLDLYYVSSEDSSVELFSKDINTKYHESTAVFTKDGRTLYFTRSNNDGKKSKGAIHRLHIYKGTLDEEGHWQVEDLPFNDASYSVAHPALSGDERTLYFSSDMPGSKGQSDLYSVAITESGYGSPKNLGEGINTEGRETFPFVNEDGLLFFSSDGQVGLGGLDVFVAEIGLDGSLGEAFNLGRPVNSSSDDMTFILDATTKNGYMSSNRGNEAGNDDIYTVTEIAPLITSCYQFVEGKVLDTGTQAAISGASVMLVNDDNVVVETVYSDALGHFSFDSHLDCNTNYAVRVSLATYATLEKNIATGNMPKEVMHVDLNMEKGGFITGTDLGEVMNLKPIYFEFDKWSITPSAEVELSKVIEVLKEFKDLKIEIHSYADSRGSESYNLSLSEKRSDATVKYIVDKGGIEAHRVSGKGYGESRPVNDCVDGTPCSAAAYKLNRRSQFIVMEK